VAEEMLKDESYHLVVLDELTYMLSFKYLDQDMILHALKNRPANQSVVVTGRGGGSALADMADTVSEIKEVKHAYNSGVMARKGVDY
jgi:cob(I)alamin adenosyltransferase